MVGLAVAWALARAGWQVALLERDAPGGGASRAAAGMLAPRVEAREPDAFLELALAGRECFRRFVPELEEASGRSLDYREDGAIALAPDLDGEADLARRAEWQRAAGLPVEELDRQEAARRWPGLELAPPPEGATPRFGEGRLFHFPDEAQVDGGRMVDALLEACAVAGVDVREGVEVQGLLRAGDRVRGVRTAHEDLACAWVVNAAGAWAGTVAGWAGESLPVEPVRGEMLAFATECRPPRPIVVAGDAYCLLRADGRLLVGATVERVGWDPSTTAAGQAWLQERAAALVPSLARLAPAGRWAGLRPGTPDDLPVLGPSAELEGLYHATGHFRNGILLAPITAGFTRADLEAEPASPLVEPFRPARFAAGARAPA